MEKRDARKLKISAQHEYLKNDFKRNVNAKNTEDFMTLLSNNPQRIAMRLHLDLTV